MKKVLIVIDMQNDFIDGSLGTKEAQNIVPNVVSLIENFNGLVMFTQDTHATNYLNTLEGKILPVKHCIMNTDGWQINKDVMVAISKRDHSYCFSKTTFGSIRLMDDSHIKDDDEITIVGLCTDICVISNALMLRAKHPNTIINVIKNCCAGVTPEKHQAALEVMRSCQINVL